MAENGRGGGVCQPLFMRLSRARRAVLRGPRAGPVCLRAEVGNSRAGALFLRGASRASRSRVGPGFLRGERESSRVAAPRAAFGGRGRVARERVGLRSPNA